MRHLYPHQARMQVDPFTKENRDPATLSCREVEFGLHHPPGLRPHRKRALDLGRPQILSRQRMEPGIVGRDPELRTIGEFLNGLTTSSGVLLLEGEPGIGKTTVWLAGRGEARRRGYRVLSCRPIQTETPLAFVALADLLGPVLDEALTHLPSPQVRALEVALVRAEAGGERPDRRAISAAVLGIIRGIAAVAPVLLAIDDLQWLDRPTARVLEFVIRRLAEEPFGVLATSRTGEEALCELDRILPPGYPQRLTVGPLSVGSLQ